MNITEAYGKGVEARTNTDEFGVTYGVFLNGTMFWQARVDFGPDDAHRAGGHAFREAAHMQDANVAAALRRQA